MGNNPFEAIELRLGSIEQDLATVITLLKRTPNSCLEDSIGVDDAAKILQLAKATLYIKTHMKIVPHRKEGKKLIFSRKELEAYILSNKVKTLKEEIGESQSLISKNSGRSKNRKAA